MTTKQLPTAIIGGGPVGLAAAAQLTVKGKDFLLFEAGTELGTNFLDYGHVRLFSTWRYNMDEAAKSLLEQHGKTLPDADILPLGADIVTHYLKPLGELPELAPHIHLNSRVIHISKSGFDKMKDLGRDEQPFLLLVENAGEVNEFQAGAVIDATGTWQTPNPLVSGGMLQRDPSVHYRLPDILHSDRNLFAGKKIAVAGSGHSAFNSLLDLMELQSSSPETEITWLTRKQVQPSLFGGGASDQLAARGALGDKIKKIIDDKKIRLEPESVIHAVSRDERDQLWITVRQNGVQKIFGPYDEIIANTGSRPDFSFLREIRHSSDPSLESVPALAPLIDPNVHSCGTVRPHGEMELRQLEKNFYIVGAKSYGRAPTFLLATGYEQVRSVVAYLSGDLEAAKRVELSLPETGVCSTDTSPFNILNKTASACC